MCPLVRRLPTRRPWRCRTRTTPETRRYVAIRMGWRCRPFAVSASWEISWTWWCWPDGTWRASRTSTWGVNICVRLIMSWPSGCVQRDSTCLCEISDYHSGASDDMSRLGCRCVSSYRRVEASWCRRFEGGPGRGLVYRGLWKLNDGRV